MAESDHYADDAHQSRSVVDDSIAIAFEIEPVPGFQPAERIFRACRESQIGGAWERRQLPAALDQSNATPQYHDDDHDRRDVHYSQRVVTRFVNPPDIAPPEIERGQYCNPGREVICLIACRLPRVTAEGRDLGNQSNNVLAG